MRIVVLGKELEYDFFDADLLEKYEKENLRVKERIQEPTQYAGKTTADSLRIQCGIVNSSMKSLVKECLRSFLVAKTISKTTWRLLLLWLMLP